MSEVQGVTPVSALGFDGRLVIFEVGHQRLGLAITLIREVVTLERLLDVPRTLRGVLGLFPLRGAPSCAIDTATLVDGEAVATRRRLGLVVVRRRVALCTLAVDRVHGVVEASSSSFIPRDPAREPPIVAGFLTLDDRAVTVLDPDELLRRVGALRFQ